jgi:hypothetical protein
MSEYLICGLMKTTLHYESVRLKIRIGRRCLTDVLHVVSNYNKICETICGVPGKVRLRPNVNKPLLRIVMTKITDDSIL